jgi:hypothetical protein
MLGVNIVTIRYLLVQFCDNRVLIRTHPCDWYVVMLFRVML